MTALSIVLDIVLILISLVLIAAVLMQQGQRQGLGAIAGGAGGKREDEQAVLTPPDR